MKKVLSLVKKHEISLYGVFTFCNPPAMPGTGGQAKKYEKVLGVKNSPHSH
ncbi:MAG: hypothetical protein HOA57_02600 [Candidatus Magasanikbacteria bacterium]|jgi:hypothetical protein|nr:hypothetical protein [Candidatus Magasanikbacteria bacterium]MBT4314838.1 hypothetical protein [Candidatus Magasanikbacteria bacterium]MBT4547615.1 hypothetical protein [Candidatus Magasanikbacteria bacterium]MBT6819245.1 hypothetical protein [Candidatus Magasanikbacteria bacterium]